MTRITNPDGTPLTTSLGDIETVEEAEKQYIETVARTMFTADHSGYEEADRDDKVALGNALEHALGIDTTGLFIQCGAAIGAAYANLVAEHGKG